MSRAPPPASLLPTSLALAAVLAACTPDSAERAEPAGVPTASSSSGETPPGALERTLPGATTPGAAAAPDETLPGAAPGGEGGVELARPPVRVGTIERVDATGAARRPASGSFRLVPLGQRPGDRTGFAVAVRDGRWEAPVELHGEVAFEDVVLEGVLAHVPGPPWIAPWREPLAVRAHDLHPRRLSVVAAAGGARVPDASVWIVAPRDGRALHPDVLDGAEPLSTDADGHVVVVPQAPDTYTWVRAPWSEWTRARVDHRVPGDVEVLLRPGGDAVVRVEPWGEDRLGFARLRRAGSGRIVAELPVLPSGLAPFVGLPPGDYDAAVECGPERAAESLARGTVSVRPGSRAAVTLALASPPAESVGLAGTVRLPAELAGAPCALHVERLDGPPRRRAEDLRLELPAGRERRWTAGPVEPGTYGVRVAPFQLERVVRIGSPAAPAGLASATDRPSPVGADPTNGYDEVGEAAEDLAAGGETGVGADAGAVVLDARTLRRVRLEVRAACGSLPADPGLAWRPVATGARAIPPVDVRADAGAAIELWAPPGRLELLASSPSLRPGPYVVDPEGDPTVVMDCMPAIELRFRRDGAPARVPRGFLMRAFRKSPPGAPGWPAVVDDGRVLVRHEEPGLYRLEFRPLPGLDPLAPTEVEVGADTGGSVVLELVPR